MRTLVIIPAYNEALSIVEVIQDIREQAIPYLDVLVVNDASQDTTSQVARTQGVAVIDLVCNLGIGGAVQVGYMYALEREYDIAIQFDGDGQHSASDLHTLLYELKHSDVDGVIGSRFLGSEGFKSSFLRRIGIGFFSGMISFLVKQRITDPTSGLRLANKKLIKLFVEYYPYDYPEPEVLVYLYKNNAKVKEAPVTMKYRTYGKSSIQFVHSIYYLVKVSLAIFIHVLRYSKK